MSNATLDIEQDGLNELIKNFLIELKNDAHRKGSKMEFVYSNALKSLNVHKDKIANIKDCRKLKYFGDKSCSILKKKLDDYCLKNSIVLPIDEEENSENLESNLNQNANNQDNDSQDSNQEASQQVRKIVQKTKRQYIPKYRSAGFAMMIALFRLEQDENNYSVTKIDLSKQAELYLGDTASTNDSQATTNMWISMKTLIDKELVTVEKSRCNFYSLTDLGRELSAKMYNTMAEKLNLNQPTTLNADDDEENNDELDADEGLNERLVYLPDTYEIILIIDSREQYSGVSIEQKKTKLVNDLQQMGVNCEMRALPIGDFAWFIRSIATTKSELVLDFLIERKKTDDLIASIRDQRWGEQVCLFFIKNKYKIIINFIFLKQSFTHTHKQKYRLKRCGIPNLIYLIEGLSSIKADHLCYKSLHTAIASAQLIDEFTVKHTKDFKDTLAYLALMSKYLEKYYASKTLFSTSKKDKQDYPLRENHFLTVNEFSCDSQKMKNFTAKEMFVRSLFRFYGATLEKCKAITGVYSTLPALLNAYDECENVKAKERLLSSITFGLPEKKIGNPLSKSIYTYFTFKEGNVIM